MNRFINILPKLALWILMLISVVATILVFAGGVVDPEAEYKEPVLLDTLLYWIGIIIGVIILVTIGFSIAQFGKNLFTEPKKALLSLGSVLLLAAVFVVTFVMSDSSQPLEITGYEGVHNRGVWLSVVTMFIDTIAIVASVAILLMLFGGLFKMKK